MSELKTWGREGADTGLGVMMVLAGVFLFFFGVFLISVENGFGYLLAPLAFLLGYFGNQKMKKAQHVAWTREALERHDAWRQARE